MLKFLCIAIGLCHTIGGPAWPIDGDTIVVEGYHVRLSGIDAEELNEPHGGVAANAMASLIYSHHLTCNLSGQRSYDRYVATCQIDGRDLGAEMVRLGYALDCARYSGGRYRQLEPVGVRQTLRQKPYC